MTALMYVKTVKILNSIISMTKLILKTVFSEAYDCSDVCEDGENIKFYSKYDQIDTQNCILGSI